MSLWETPRRWPCISGKGGVREVKAVVSGEGADELFGGYQIYCEPASLRPYQLLPEAWRKAAAKLG